MGPMDPWFFFKNKFFQHYSYSIRIIFCGFYFVFILYHVHKGNKFRTNKILVGDFYYQVDPLNPWLKVLVK